MLLGNYNLVYFEAKLSNASRFIFFIEDDFGLFCGSVENPELFFKISVTHTFGTMRKMIISLYIVIMYTFVTSSTTKTLVSFPLKVFSTTLHPFKEFLIVEMLSFLPNIF